MSESAFSKRLRRGLADVGVTCYRIESHATNPGLPDIHYICGQRGISGWIETKCEPTLPSHIQYRPQQALWLDNYTKLGGRCCTMMLVEQQDAVLVIPGKLSLAAGKQLPMPWAKSTLVDLASPVAWASLKIAL